ncbi:hypothetical protein QAD02_000179 [Eretmocerus hayati]|uniref:Uncharacterized protein n=1 Tax=Eretmocerus hayati TaxID=131215 RepID=A0ACC2NCP9_9HYME|nr:hypothetical protein QAD02_000179 [Eretmocerus hayati]
MSSNKSRLSRQADADDRSKTKNNLRVKSDEPRHSKILRFRKQSRNILRSVIANVAVNSKIKIGLHEAIAKGDAESVNSLLKAGASPNDVDNEGDTPLLLAVLSDRTDLAQQVIEAGANVNATLDSYGNTNLHLAVMKRNTEMVQLLLSSGALPNSVNNDGNTPLHVTFKRRDLSLLQEMLGVIDAPSGCSTPHPELVQEDLEIMHLLLKAGASPNIVGKKGDTPLLLAIRSEKIELVQQLINGGADVNYIQSKSNHGYRPKSTLHEAVHVCNIEIVKLLLDLGVNPNRSNGLRESVLFTASRASRNRISILKLLLDHGANMYVAGFSGSRGIFEEMLLSNDIDGVRLFLEYGFDLRNFEPLGPEYSFPLHLAVQYYEIGTLTEVNHDTSMLEILLDHYEKIGTLSIELDKADFKGSQPIFYTAEDRHNHLDLLLQSGADPNCEDREGQTPLEVGLFEGNGFHPECIRLLIKAGARVRNCLDRLFDYADLNGMADMPHENYTLDSDESSESEDSMSDSDYRDMDALDAHDDELCERYTRRSYRSMKKALCIVKYRALYEDQIELNDPIDKKIRNSSTLQNYYKACKAEIALLQTLQFGEFVTSYDVLTEENFWRGVKSSNAFEDFHDEFLLDSSEGNIHIYLNDLKEGWKFGYELYELWGAATRALECLLELDRDSYHLIFSNILNRLNNQDLHNLGEIGQQ